LEQRFHSRQEENEQKTRILIDKKKLEKFAIDWIRLPRRSFATCTADGRVCILDTNCKENSTLRSIQDNKLKLTKYVTRIICTFIWCVTEENWRQI